MSCPTRRMRSCMKVVPSSHALCRARTRMRSLVFMVRSVSFSEVSFQASLQPLDEQLVAAVAGSDPDALVIGLMRVLHVHNHPFALAVAHDEVHKSLLRVLRIENVIRIKRVIAFGRMGADIIPKLARQAPQCLLLVWIRLRRLENDRLFGFNRLAQTR